jgi:hypothetical protein
MQADRPCGGATAVMAKSHRHCGDDNVVDELDRIKPSLHRHDQMPELGQHHVVFQRDGELAEQRNTTPRPAAGD